MKKRLVLLLMVVLCLLTAAACKEKIVEQQVTILLFEKEQLTIPNKSENVKWQSADSSIVMVDQEGMIEGLAPGQTDVTVSKKENTIAVFHITVDLIAVEDIMIDPVSADLQPGDSIELSYKLIPQDASVYQIEWRSENEDIAKVDANGNVQAVGAGETDIYCSAPNGKRNACHVIVKEPSAYELLNEYEKGLFDYMVESFLPSVYNAPALRIRNSYGAIGTENTFMTSLDIQGTNRLGGTIYKVYMFFKTIDSWSCFDNSDYFNRSIAELSDPEIFDYKKVNAALEEYWKERNVDK